MSTLPTLSECCSEPIRFPCDFPLGVASLLHYPRFMFKSFIGIVLATVIVFAWGSVSWMLVPYHEASIHPFENEDVVTTAMVDAAKSGDGVYVSPYTEGMTEAESQAAFRKGPMIFTSIRTGGNEDYTMGRQFLRAILATLVAALILGIMLSAAAPRLNYIGRVLFVTLGGVLRQWRRPIPIKFGGSSPSILSAFR